MDGAVEQHDERLEEAILTLLAGRSGTICPSEAARAVAGDRGDWRALMEPARAAAHRLVEVGAVEVTQRGEVVDVREARGPVRIRRATGRRPPPAGTP